MRQVEIIQVSFAAIEEQLTNTHTEGLALDRFCV